VHYLFRLWVQDVRFEAPNHAFPGLVIPARRLVCVAYRQVSAMPQAVNAGFFADFGACLEAAPIAA
jgi:hypothetical protein